MKLVSTLTFTIRITKKAKCLYGTNFSFAERDFFINKLLKVTPNMSQEAINQSIAFLERQKEANCPCAIHTQKRGYDWIVFNQLPDRMPSNQDYGNQMSDSGDSTGFSDTESNTETKKLKCLIPSPVMKIWKR